MWAVGKKKKPPAQSWAASQCLVLGAWCLVLVGGWVGLPVTMVFY